MFQAISQIKNLYAGKEKRKQGILLDIDETISVTRDKYIEIFAKELGNPENLSVSEIIAKYKYTWNVPYWKENERYSEIAQGLVVSPEIHKDLNLIENVADYVKRLGEIVYIAGYLSARPAVLQNITENWLKEKGLPAAPVILSPSYVTGFHAWKASILEYLYPEVLGIVDDNPGMIAELNSSYKGTLFIYDYAGQSDRTDIDTVPCPDWESVLVEVEKRIKAA